MQSSPMLNDLSEADLKLALAYASPTEKVLINKILDELKQRELRERAQNGRILMYCNERHGTGTV